ncbi:MAG TPA: ABC transporter permease [Nitrososphaeraceae archaeon]|jgi:putative ABC transport system permease protein
MNLVEIFQFSFEALMSRKLRSILTILMVMAGSSLLNSVNGFGAGFSELFNKQFSNLAPNVMFVTSSQQQEQGGGPGSAPPPPAKITLNSAVINRIKSLPFVDDVIPTYQSQIDLHSKSDTRTVSVFSVDPDKLKIISPTLEYEDGSTLRPNDPSAMIVAHDVANPPGKNTPFITLGQSVRATYSFVDPDSGKQKEESKNFVVTAIGKQTGNPTIDNAVIINLNSGNNLLQKSNKYDTLFTVARSNEFVGQVEKEIRSLYGNDIGITTLEALLKTVKEFTGGINSFLLSIAVISLIVGGVGIITTLYTSVIERIREIGTLKAIGTESKYILFLFLIEALLIGVMGATLGLLGGVAGGFVLGNLGPRNGPPLIPVYLASDMATVWIISVSLSIVAGLFPAWKASRTLPIEALRPQ